MLFSCSFYFSALKAGRPQTRLRWIRSSTQVAFRSSCMISTEWYAPKHISVLFTCTCVSESPRHLGNYAATTMAFPYNWQLKQLSPKTHQVLTLPPDRAMLEVLKQEVREAVMNATTRGLKVFYSNFNKFSPPATPSLSPPVCVFFILLSRLSIVF